MHPRVHHSANRRPWRYYPSLIRHATGRTHLGQVPRPTTPGFAPVPPSPPNAHRVQAASPAPAQVAVQAPARGEPPIAQGRGAARDGDPIANPAPNPRLRLLRGENTRDTLRSTPLPTINGCTFCKRWHLGMSCWTQCARAALHVQPTNAIVNTVAAALAVERAAAAVAARP